MDDLTWNEDDRNDEPLHGEEDLAWDASDSGADDDIDAADAEDDWESLDVDELVQQQKKKTKDKEAAAVAAAAAGDGKSNRQLRREIEQLKEEVKRLKVHEQQQQQQQQQTAAGGRGSKGGRQNDMMTRYQIAKADFDATADLVGDMAHEQPRIELLRPQTDKEASDFAGIVSEKLLEFQDMPFFAAMVKEIVTSCVGTMASGEVFDLQKTVDRLRNEALEREREAKRGGGKRSTKKVTLRVEKEMDVLDRLAMGGSAAPDSNGTFDDDDFM